MVGIFSAAGSASLVNAGIADGTYENLITGGPVEVRDGRISTDGEPIILKA